MTCRSRSTPAMASFRWAVYGLSMGVTMSARRVRSALPDASRAIPGPSKNQTGVKSHTNRQRLEGNAAATTLSDSMRVIL